MILSLFYIFEQLKSFGKIWLIFLFILFRSISLPDVY